MLRSVLTTASALILALSSVYGQNLLLNPESVAFDYQNNRYLVSNVGDGAIVQIDSNGVQSYFAQGLGFCAGNCIVGNTLYVSADSLIGIDLDSGEIVFSLVIPALNNLDGMAADSSGHLYVVDTYGMIYKIYLSDTTYSYFVPSGLGTLPQDIIYDHAPQPVNRRRMDGKCPPLRGRFGGFLSFNAGHHDRRIFRRDYDGSLRECLPSVVFRCRRRLPLRQHLH
jgi:hypothetical protein